MDAHPPKRSLHRGGPGIVLDLEHQARKFIQVRNCRDEFFRIQDYRAEGQAIEDGQERLRRINALAGSPSSASLRSRVPASGRPAEPATRLHERCGILSGFRPRKDTRTSLARS